jgi:phosphatidylinositol-4-phosphate 3-kinase
MIKHSGHIFHIDFAKFLGDAQMFGSIKRDRTPFVLTSDMAYVINGGDKPTERFQYFVDLCCHAFNIIRKNSNLFINLLSLMTLSGIPGVTADAPKYVQKSLLPDRSDAEAVAELTRMINMCLQSLFTQVNFFIHNLAQMKFSGHDDGSLLSFVPKTYSLQTDGRIKSIDMYGIQKRYSPDKHYVYIVRVEREAQRVASYILRRYSEFQELHRKLVMTFPLVRLPSLSGRVYSDVLMFEQ